MRQRFFNLRVKFMGTRPDTRGSRQDCGHQPQRYGQPYGWPLSVLCVGDAAARKGAGHCPD